jgi:hypothetical protein
LAGAAHLLMHHQHRKTVAVDAREVGLHHRLRRGGGEVVGHAPGPPVIEDLAANAVRAGEHAISRADVAFSP